MSVGLDNLRHIIVLMMENRSFDHLLGGLKKKSPKIAGLNDSRGQSGSPRVQVPSTPTFKTHFKLWGKSASGSPLGREACISFILHVAERDKDKHRV